MAFFLQNIFQLHQQRCVILRVDSLGLWEIINEEDVVLITKNRELLLQIFAVGIFWGGVSCYAATPLIVGLSPGHSDITTFLPWSPIAPDRKSFGLRRPKNFQQLLIRLAPLTFLIRVQAFRDPLRGELPHVQIFMNDGPNPLT